MTILVFLLATLVLLPIGLKLAPWGIGIPIFALGLALILPERRDEPTVTIEDIAFVPEVIKVEAGDTVTWIWNDGAVAHDVAGDDFRSEVMSEGTFSYRFDEPGSYDYVSTLHPNMTGTIEVTG
jgi:Cupredoxin-like domain